MPRPRVSEFWREEARRIKAKNPSRSAQGIRNDLVALKRGNPPAVSTLVRIVKEFDELEEREKVPYRELSWPGSFGSGDDDLPWESSSALMELLYFSRDAGLARPTVELARIFWNATRSAPDADLLTRIEITARLALGKTEGVEGYLGRRGYLLVDGEPRETLPPLVFDLSEGRTATILFGLPLLIPLEEAARILGVESLGPLVGSGYLTEFSGMGKRRPGVMLGEVLELADNVKEGRIEIVINPMYLEKGGNNDG